MTKSSNPQREQRILDAAAQLFVHYGYDKTTISDIAREAGVSKGSIYLHFESKDALFEALLLREMEAYSTRWIGLLEADPRGGTIGGMYKASLAALNASQFMAALFRQDRRILGSYLRKPEVMARNREHLAARHGFVVMMQQAGAMRGDIDARVVAHVMNMLAFGLVGLDDMLATEVAPTTEALLDGIAEIMDRALTPQDGGNSEAGKAIARAVFEAARQAQATDAEDTDDH